MVLGLKSRSNNVQALHLAVFIPFKTRKIHSHSPNLAPPGRNMEFLNMVGSGFTGCPTFWICLIASSWCNLTFRSVSCILENGGFGEDIA